MLDQTHATLASLQTIVVKVEAVLNNRPLTHTSSDVTDAEPITPSHLLYGRPVWTSSQVTLILAPSDVLIL